MHQCLLSQPSITVKLEQIPQKSGCFNAVSSSLALGNSRKQKLTTFNNAWQKCSRSNKAHTGSGSNLDGQQQGHACEAMAGWEVGRVATLQGVNVAMGSGGQGHVPARAFRIAIGYILVNQRACLADRGKEEIFLTARQPDRQGYCACYRGCSKNHKQ